MDKIRSSQTQSPSFAGSAAGESSDGSVSASAAIVDQVLGVQRRRRKGVGCIIKAKRKAPDTSCSTTVTGLLEQSSQVAEDHRLLRERVDTQQPELDALKVFVTHTLGQASPPPPPSPPPPSDDAEDLCRDQVFQFFFFLDFL